MTHCVLSAHGSHNPANVRYVTHKADHYNLLSRLGHAISTACRLTDMHEDIIPYTCSVVDQHTTYFKNDRTYVGFVLYCYIMLIQ